MHVDYDIFGLAAGLEDQTPVTDAGGYDKVGPLSSFISIAAVVLARQYTDVVEREELSAVRVPAQHQIRAGRSLFVVTAGLVVQDDLVQIRIQAFHQFSRGQARTAPCLLRLILTSDDIEAVIDQNRLVLQDSYMVFLKILQKVAAVPAPGLFIEITSVVVAVAEEDAVCRLEISKRFAASDQVFPGRVVIDEIPGDDNNVRMELIDLKNIVMKLWRVKGCPDVRVCDLDDAQITFQPAAFQTVIFLPDVRTQNPGCHQIAHREQDGNDAWDVTGDLPARGLPQNQEEQLTQHPESAEMDKDDDGVDRIQCQVQNGAHSQIKRDAQPECRPLPARESALQKRKLRCPGGDKPEAEDDADHDTDHDEDKCAHTEFLSCPACFMITAF